MPPAPESLPRRPGHRISGLLLVLTGIGLALPIPFTNYLFGLADRVCGGADRARRPCAVDRMDRQRRRRDHAAGAQPHGDGYDPSPVLIGRIVRFARTFRGVNARSAFGVAEDSVQHRSSRWSSRARRYSRRRRSSTVRGERPLWKSIASSVRVRCSKNDSNSAALAGGSLFRPAAATCPRAARRALRTRAPARPARDSATEIPDRSGS